MHKRTLWAVSALIVAAAVLAGVFFLTRRDTTGKNQEKNTEPSTGQSTEPSTEQADNKKTIHVIITHKDGTNKELTLETEDGHLGAALINAGLVQAEKNRFGTHIKEADGEKAVFEEDSAYWAVYVGDAFAPKSTDLTPVEEGRTYKLVYTEPVLEDPSDPTWYLLNHVYMPIARGQVGTNWDTVSAFFKKHGYETKIDEGTYGIEDPYRGWSHFGGDLTNENGYEELASLEYTICEGDDIKACAGVFCRSEKNIFPTYHINIDFLTNQSEQVDSLKEVEAYIRNSQK